MSADIKHYGNYIIANSRSPEESVKSIIEYAEEKNLTFELIHFYEPDIQGSVRKYMVVAIAVEFLTVGRINTS